MGWCGGYYGNRAPKGKDRLSAVLRSENLDVETEYGVVLASALVGTTVYCAYHNKKLNKTVGMVLLSRFEDNGYLMVKVIDESAGPCESQCPKKILSLLSPLPEEGGTMDAYARSWRERCYAYHASQKNDLSKLPYGTQLMVHDPDKHVLFVTKDHNGRRAYLGYGIRATPHAIRYWGYDIVEDGSKSKRSVTRLRSLPIRTQNL